MRPLVRSALRVARRRPAGPVLIALGLLVATLMASGTQLALDAAEQAEREADAAALGSVMARIRTPGGYTVDEPALLDLRTQLAGQARPSPGEASLPLYLERDAIVTTGQGTSADWHIVGIPQASLEALGLPVPAEGQALVDPGPHPAPSGSLTARVQRAPSENITLNAQHPGQLQRTVRVGSQYNHAAGDEYEFTIPVEPGASELRLFLATADNDTDFDLEAVAPNGSRTLDDRGTPAQPVLPRIEVEDPEAGNWTVRVHAKFARQVAFRLEAERVFPAREARTLGRLLAGEGFHALGAQLGLTEQARLELAPQLRGLEVLGPGARGLIVLPLDRLQPALGLEGQADGLLVMAAADEEPLVGLPASERTQLEQGIERARAQASGRLDPLTGLALEPTADQRRQAREARLDSTADLLFVVLPAGVAAGVLLATWAAGLHTRRMAAELRVMAGLGQRRRVSWSLVAAHLGPPFLIGSGLALAASPVVGWAIARGLGAASAIPAWPIGPALIVPALAAVPVAATAWATLRHPVEGQDPRARDRPPGLTGRWATSGLLGLAALAAGAAAWLAPLGPADTYLAAGLGVAAGVGALLWAPWPEGLLERPRALSVGAMGLFRTRSAHPYQALAGATVVLVLAAGLAGTALSQASTPDPQVETGGYAVVAETPTYREQLVPLLPESGPLAQRGRELISASQGAEFLMRVTGTGIHSADTGPEQTVYGIDAAFAQRHEHRVRPIGGTQDPFRAVANSDEKALVSTSVWRAMDGQSLAVRGPQGQLSYEVVGVVETRLFEGVYLSKDAMPVHFTRIGGQQRFLLGEETDPERYAEGLTTVFKDAGLEAASAGTLVDEALAGQKRAGRTLQAMAGLGLATALLLVGLIGLRARAERRTTDAVFVALGARTRSLAAGIAFETALPVLAGGVAAAALVPFAVDLDRIEGLAFPLLPIDAAGLVLGGALLVGGLVALAAAVAAGIAYRAVGGLDQRALRELE